MNYPTFWRGDVYYANLGENCGSVQSGFRPVIIIQNNKGNQNGPTLVVIPMSTEIKKAWLPVHVFLSTASGIDENSIAMCEQVTTIAKSQVGPYMCSLSETDLDRINRALLISLGVPSRYYSTDRQGNDEMIITLCHEHLQPFFHNRSYRVQRLDHLQSKEQCVCCDKMGYDYRITTINRQMQNTTTTGG